MERRLHVWLALAGLGILFLGNYTASLPSIYRQSSFWTTSPTYFAIRVGILMMTISAVYGLARALEPRGIPLRPLARFGRDSLFVYWIHVELVYGYATWPIRQRLPIVGSFIACVLFTALMYAAVVAKGRFMDRRRTAGRSSRAGANHGVGGDWRRSGLDPRFTTIPLYSVNYSEHRGRPVAGSGSSGGHGSARSSTR